MGCGLCRFCCLQKVLHFLHGAPWAGRRLRDVGGAGGRGAGGLDGHQLGRGPVVDHEGGSAVLDGDGHVALLGLVWGWNAVDSAHT